MKANKKNNRKPFEKVYAEKFERIHDQLWKEVIPERLNIEIWSMHPDADTLKEKLITGMVPKEMLSNEQRGLLHHLAERSRLFKEKYPDIPWSLQDYARHAHTTTAELARVLLTLPDIIRKGFVKYYRVPLRRTEQNLDDTPQEDYLESYKAFQEVLKGTSLGTDKEATIAIEEYSFDKRLVAQGDDEDLLDLVQAKKYKQDQKKAQRKLSLTIEHDCNLDPIPVQKNETL
jgi:hypothetical protein